MATLDPDRQKLLETALGSHLTWSAPQIVETVGPYDPVVFERYEAIRRAVIDECLEKLRTYTNDRIEIILQDRDDDPMGTLRNWRHFCREKIERLSRRPPWYAGGFGDPDHAADFDYWAKMPSFTVEELLHLSVGVEPTTFRSEFLHSIASKEPSELILPLRFLLRRKEQLNRQFGGPGRPSKTAAKEFLRWAERVELETPPELLASLRRYHMPESAAQETKRRSSQPDKREIKTIAQLFTAMAIEIYGYRPDQPKSPIPREIADLASSMGLSVSPETIRKYLSIGAESIPKDWKAE